MKNIIRIPLIMGALSASMAAQADIRINGFANFVGGITSSDDTFLGYDDTLSFEDESLFALQVSGDINSNMTATAQIIARGENDFSADFEWAYLAYSFNNSTKVTAGRFLLPLFNFSASKDIGYSHHWVAPPSTVYDVPFTNMDGVKVDYATYAGDWEFNFTAALGTYKGFVGDLGSDNIGDNTFLFSTEAIYENFKFRGVYGSTQATLDILNATDPTIAQLAQAFETIEAIGLTDLANSLRLEEDDGTFYGLSVQYDNFDWFAGAEWTTVAIDDSFADDDVAYYVTLGKRFGKWTPSFTYQNLTSDGLVKYTDQIAQLAQLPLPAAAIGQLQGAAVGIQLAQEADFDITTLSLRYDLNSGIAIKADITSLKDDVDESNDATTFRVAVNYVF